MTKPSNRHRPSLNREIAWAGATDAGNQHRRTTWSREDYATAVREFDQLWPLNRDLYDKHSKETTE